MQDTALYLHVSDNTVRRLIERDILDAIKLGRRWYVYVDSIKDFQGL